MGAEIGHCSFTAFRLASSRPDLMKKHKHPVSCKILKYGRDLGCNGGRVVS